MGALAHLSKLLLVCCFIAPNVVLGFIFVYADAMIGHIKWKIAVQDSREHPEQNDRHDISSAPIPERPSNGVYLLPVRLNECLSTCACCWA